jgi:hypothetical protein
LLAIALKQLHNREIWRISVVATRNDEIVRDIHIEDNPQILWRVTWEIEVRLCTLKVGLQCNIVRQKKIASCQELKTPKEGITPKIIHKGIHGHVAELEHRSMENLHNHRS